MADPDVIRQSDLDKQAIDAYRERTTTGVALDVIYLVLFAGGVFACAAAAGASRKRRA